jgi:Zn-dependent protease
VSILVHELGHAIAVRVHGWRPWITLYGFGGLASYQPTRHDARSQILISAAGPAAGFLFIAFVMAAVQASGHTVQLFPDPKASNLFPPWAAFEIFDSFNVNVLVFYLWQINILWGLLNLLPIYPLDGGQIMRELCLSAHRSRGIEQSLWISIVVSGGVAILAILLFGDLFLALMFGYLAYTNYTTLQRFTGRGGFGGPGGW